MQHFGGNDRMRDWPAPQLTLTRFVGRSEEVDGVAHLLDSSHLVTVVGPPGVGKTRLAVEVARRSAGRFAGGLVPVALAAVPAAEDLAGALAGALAVRQRREADLTDSLVQAVRTADVLLLLDSCEHLAAPVGELVGRMLAGSPGLRVLATSRVPLGLPGERLHRLRPLGPAAAAELFLDRAALVTELAPDASTYALVDRLCSHLDGLPLAIELAARQARVLALPDLLDRLDTEVATAQIPHASSPEHRTLAATIAWSRGRLSPAQVDVLDDLSVFVDSFDLAAATAVVGDHSHLVQDLAALVDHSLLLAETGSSGELDYRLLEPVRQHAADHLERSGRSVRLRRAHALHTLAAATRAARGLMSVGGQYWYERLRQLEGNVLAAASWARGERSDLALRLVTCLAGYWEHRGQTNAAAARIGALLAVGIPAPGARAEALLALCQLGYRQGRYTEAVGHAEEAADLMTTLGSCDGTARALRALGQAAAAAGAPDRAVRCCERSLEIFRDLGDRQAQAWSLTVLAYAHFNADDLEAGAAAGTAALRLLESTDPAPAVSRRTHVGLSYVAFRRGDLAAHRRHLSATVADLRLLGAVDGEAEWMWSGLALAHSEGRMRAVLRLAGAARDLGQQGASIPRSPARSSPQRSRTPRTASGRPPRRSCAAPVPR